MILKKKTKKLFLCGKICKFFEGKKNEKTFFMWKKQSKSVQEKNVIKTKPNQLFYVENNSKFFEKKKKRTEKMQIAF